MTAQEVRQVFHRDRRLAASEHDPLDGVAKLPHIAGPRKTLTQLHCLGRQFLAAALMFGCKMIEKSVDEQRNVLGAFAQGRNGEGDDLQAVEQVLAEPARSHRLLQFLVGGSHNPHVDLDQFRAAHHAEGAVFDDAQQIALAFRRQVADFVEEQRTAVGQQEAAGLVGQGPGERAFPMAEQFGFDQLFRQRGAVDEDERLVRPRAALVDEAGDEFLARAAFAFDQDGHVAARDFLRHADHATHGLVVADQQAGLGALLEPGAQGLVLCNNGLEFQRLGDEDPQSPHVERLRQVIVGALLHRLDGVFDRAVRCHQNEQRVAADLARLLEQLEAAHARHAHVSEDEVVGMAGGEGQRGGCVVGCVDRVAFAPQRLLHPGAQSALIIHHQDPDLRLIHRSLGPAAAETAV